MSTVFPIDVSALDFQNNPYHYYSALHERDLIYYDSKMNAYFVGNYADVSHILTSRVFTTIPLAKRAQPVMRDRVLAQMEGDEHASKRRMVIHGLHGKALRERTSMLVGKRTTELLAPFLRNGVLVQRFLIARVG